MLESVTFIYGFDKSTGQTVKPARALIKSTSSSIPFVNFHAEQGLSITAEY